MAMYDGLHLNSREHFLTCIYSTTGMVMDASYCSIQTIISTLVSFHPMLYTTHRPVFFPFGCICTLRLMPITLRFVLGL